MASDKKLLAGCQADKKAAFDGIFQTYQHPLFRYVAGLCGNSELAEDLCQEAFLRFYNALPRFDAERGVAPYLFKIATNLWRNHRRLSHEDRIISGAEEPAGAPVDDTVMRALERRAILNVIDGLRPEYRKVLTLRYDAGFSYREIAAVTGVNIDTVATWLKRAIAEVRTALQKPLAQEVQDENDLR
jgi:RNA polymerase sigma-70 factor, ECF subfamily